MRSSLRKGILGKRLIEAKEIDLLCLQDGGETGLGKLRDQGSSWAWRPGSADPRLAMVLGGYRGTLEVFIRDVLTPKAVYWKINVAAVCRMISRNEPGVRRVGWKIVKGIQV